MHCMRFACFHKVINERLSFAVADRLLEKQCVVLKLPNKKGDENSTFFVCPSASCAKHVCSFIGEPIEKWYQDIKIYKSCCGYEQTSAAWYNKTMLGHCDGTWQEQFLKENRFLNLSSRQILALAQGGGLITPSSLQVLIWVIGVLAVCGNLVVFVTSLRSLKLLYKSLTKVQRVHHILLINLAVADFLMGVCTLSVAVIAVDFNGPNGRLEMIFSLASFCTFLGAVNIVSSQMSVTVLVMITTFRLHSTLRPYEPVNVKLATGVAAAGWVIWISISCIPLLPIDGLAKVFDRVAIGACDSSRSPDILTFAQVANMVNSFLKEINSTCSAKGHHLLHGKKSTLLRSSFQIEKSFHMAKRLKLINNDAFILLFYAEQNHCSPRYFYNGQDPSKVFGFPVIVYNLLAFLYILVAYLFIGCKTSQCRPRRIEFNMSSFSDGLDTARESENIRLQRKIFLIIVTDFFCWVPMSVVSFFYVVYIYNSRSGSLRKTLLEWKQPLSMFSLITVSFNSSVNPLLYSSAPCTVLSRIFSAFAEPFRKCCSHNRRNNDFSTAPAVTSNLSNFRDTALPEARV